ncbi:MAG: exo-alpha-sialidase [Ruminococcaceae bacterium]|nr:exo-alpha-sialidase [Oscillospiraceae bacterium]
MSLKKISQLNKISQARDSHAEAVNSRLSRNFREKVTMVGAKCPAVSYKVYYPRIKKCADGTYIMFNQDSRVSACVYYAKSYDGLYYSNRQPLFNASLTVRDDGEEDKLCYASCDAIVLKSGKILAFASYRYNKGYVLDAKYSGLLMKVSEDNGSTWSKEKLIYLGRNWEPHAIQLESGEVQVYFSHTAPKFYLDKTVRTDSKIHTSSGSAMLRSLDEGESWEPYVMAPPYAAHRVTQNYVETMENGTKIFTNQMPVALALNNGDIALATESDMAVGRFMLTMSYSNDNWARPLDIDEDGPKDKQAAFAYGAGPYLAQFESGETVLAYNTLDMYHIRMGDGCARNFTEDRMFIAFDEKHGYWGSILTDSSHSLLVAMPNVRETKDERGRIIGCDNDMMIERYYLNHDIRAEKYEGGKAWDRCGDALFAGGKCRAQISLRVAYDEDNLYVRVDRVDDVLEHRDGEKIFISCGDGFITCDYSLEGEDYCTYNARKVKDIAISTTLYGKLDGPAFSDNGAVTEIKIPRKYIGDADTIGIYAKLKDYCGDNCVTDGFPGIDENDKDTYYKVSLK